MNYKYKLYLLFIIGFLTGSQSYSQAEVRSLRLGISYGVGKQQIFPYNNSDYSYNVHGYKGLINYPLRKSGKFTFELQVEPGIYIARHQLLNKFFIQPDRGANYLELRDLFAQEKTITEYALNIGIQVRYNLGERISFFILGSTGPMYTDTETERLAKGFAFSDIFAFGIAYKVGKITFELRPGLRHVSNLNTQYPNSGHNSSNIDFGISVAL
jgi:hypothetical protein